MVPACICPVFDHVSLRSSPEKSGSFLLTVVNSIDWQQQRRKCGNDDKTVETQASHIIFYHFSRLSGCQFSGAAIHPLAHEPCFYDVGAVCVAQVYAYWMFFLWRSQAQLSLKIGYGLEEAFGGRSSVPKKFKSSWNDYKWLVSAQKLVFPCQWGSAKL